MRRTWKKTVTVALACLLAVGTAGCGIRFDGASEELKKVDPSQKGTPEVFARMRMRGVDENEMPIGGFIGPTDYYQGNGYGLPSLITDEVFSALSECGLNFITDTKIDLTEQAETAETVLNFADKYEISWFMPHTSIHSVSRTGSGSVIAEATVLAEELKRISDAHPYFAGLYGMDEPSNVAYADIKISWDTLKEARTIIGDAYSDLSIYYNLFPPCNGIGTDENGKLIGYQEYLDGYVATGAEYMMFDSYPFVGMEGEVAGSWLNLLGQINRTAKAGNMPWMGYIQCGGHYDLHEGHRVINENELNYDVHTMLALGAKGVSYFPGVMPPEWSSLPEEDSQDNSLIDKYGNKTPYWFYAQKINKQIKAIDEVLMNSAHMGVISAGKGACVYTGSDSVDNFRQLTAVAGDPALIGCFDYKGGTALYVVNNSLEIHRGEIRLTFDREYEYEVIQRGISCPIVTNEFTLTLEAGEGALVIIK